jgi:hypothetical protein
MENTVEIRWVHGNKTNIWYPVTSEDRDFDHGLTTKEVNKMSEKEMMKKYYKPIIWGNQ